MRKHIPVPMDIANEIECLEHMMYAYAERTPDGELNPNFQDYNDSALEHLHSLQADYKKLFNALCSVTSNEYILKVRILADRTTKKALEIEQAVQLYYDNWT